MEGRPEKKEPSRSDDQDRKRVPETEGEVGQGGGRCPGQEQGRELQQRLALVCENDLRLETSEESQRREKMTGHYYGNTKPSQSDIDYTLRSARKGR